MRGMRVNRDRMGMAMDRKGMRGPGMTRPAGMKKGGSVKMAKGGSACKPRGMKKGGSVKMANGGSACKPRGMKKGGSIDGCAVKGKTRP